MDVTRQSQHCPRCGAALPREGAEGLCAACLLSAGVETLTGGSLSSEAPTVLAGVATAGEAGRSRLDEGQAFGPYRIGRLLGRGGMGEVYEAEHLESGRRLALKVLRAQLADADDRARFLYEGRLAASVSHPHTVYIYGSEEIGGLPVITMELLPGGTLKDLVAARGPLPPAEAANAILDLIGGLDAAQAAGILHRDIKPSNCFIDADGQVKVGDFGLSISTLARDAQAGTGGMFQGTPQFAAPEQLLGRPLDLRADIYAAGATLFYLLTGRPPFEAPDLRELVRRVTTEPPPSPRAIQPRVPAGLAALVQRCLAKDPAARPASYAALADELRPFTSASAEPARPGFRAVAGVIDSVLIGLPAGIRSAMTIDPAPRGFQVTVETEAAILAVSIGVLYFTVLEGLWGASLGKRIMGLRVTGVSGPASWTRIALRTFCYYAAALPGIAISLLAGEASLIAFLEEHRVLAVLYSISTLVLTAALFVTARRANGYAAVHDLASGTRVIMRPRAAEREGARTADRPEGVPLSGVRCGPFDVVADLGETDGGRLLEAFDPVLRRRVWIRAVPAGTPDMPPARRDLARPGRLRWLAGRRGPLENWDAYEAPDGASLSRLPAGRSWRIVRTWLADLAAEIAASERDGTRPTLDVNRVWVRPDGRVILLDLPAPGLAAPGRGAAAPDPPQESAGFLATVAHRALHEPAPHAGSDPASRAAEVPLSARGMLRRWREAPSTPIERVLQELAIAATAPASVQRWRRAVPAALAGVPLLLALGAGAAGIPAMRAMASAERYETYALVLRLATDERSGVERTPRHDAIETYLAGVHRERLVDPRWWSLTQLDGDSGIDVSAAAARVAAARPVVTDEEIAAARPLIAKDLEDAAAKYQTMQEGLTRAAGIMVAILVALGGALGFVGTVVGALAVPGGVMTRLLGLAVVTRGSAEISRARSVLRAVLLWSPWIVWVSWLGLSPIQTMSASGLPPLVPALAVILIMAIGAGLTLVRPEQSPVDRLLGVRVVPR